MNMFARILRKFALQREMQLFSSSIIILPGISFKDFLDGYRYMTVKGSSSLPLLAFNYIEKLFTQHYQSTPCPKDLADEIFMSTVHDQ